MNKEYLEEIFNENKDKFFQLGFEFENAKELEEDIMYILESTFKIEFNIDIDSKKLFSKENEKNIKI